jgi:hypothetical protein
MYQVTYVSTARTGQSWSAIDDILNVARSNNRRDGITGLLVHDGRRFLQILEGEEGVLTAAFQRIAADDRHTIDKVVAARDIPDREFAGWDMACQEVSTLEDGRSLAASIERMVSRVVDSDLRAALAGFAGPVAMPVSARVIAD